jgi:hypothetical protein
MTTPSQFVTIFRGIALCYEKGEAPPPNIWASLVTLAQTVVERPPPLGRATTPSTIAPIGTAAPEPARHVYLKDADNSVREVEVTVTMPDGQTSIGKAFMPTGMMIVEEALSWRRENGIWPPLPEPATAPDGKPYWPRMVNGHQQRPSIGEAE